MVRDVWLNMAVLNKYKQAIPSDAVYIGRGSRWGNPFTHLKGTSAQHVVKDREAACMAHAQWIKQEIREGSVTLQDLAELHGKDLVCFCAPKACHGDNLEKLALWAHNKLNPKGENHEL